MNTYFTEEEYTNDLGLDVNEEVLERMQADGIHPEDELNIHFAFLTDTEEKANSLSEYLKENYAYNQVNWTKTEDGLFEVNGLTDAIPMDLQSINSWNLELWDAGYEFDCKLDGWYVGKE